MMASIKTVRKYSLSTSAMTNNFLLVLADKFAEFEIMNEFESFVVVGSL